MELIIAFLLTIKVLVRCCSFAVLSELWESDAIACSLMPNWSNLVVMCNFIIPSRKREMWEWVQKLEIINCKGPLAKIGTRFALIWLIGFLKICLNFAQSRGRASFRPLAPRNNEPIRANSFEIRHLSHWCLTSLRWRHFSLVQNSNWQFRGPPNISLEKDPTLTLFTGHWSSKRLL